MVGGPARPARFGRGCRCAHVVLLSVGNAHALRQAAVAITCLETHATNLQTSSAPARFAPSDVSSSGSMDWKERLSTLGRTAGKGSFLSEQELEAALVAHGLDLSSWGTGCAKSVEDLFHELEHAETMLHFGARGVHRWLNVVKVRVKRPGQPQLLLVEARQLFPDGRERRRGLPLSEKMFANEAPLAAARRGLEEELGSALIKGASVYVDAASLTQWRETRESHSYPSLLSHYNLHEVDAVIDGLPSETFSTVEFGPRRLGKWELAHVWEWTSAKRSRSAPLFHDLATLWAVPSPQSPSTSSECDV